MFICFRHTNGKVYKLPISQMSLHTSDGWPCALAYEREGLIIYTDANDADFGTQVQSLYIKREEPPK